MTRRVVVVAAAFILSGWATPVTADVMDGVNVNAANDPTWEFGAADYGWFYTPGSAYTLTGIETRFGSSDGRTCTLEFFKNGPRSVSGWELLGSADFTTAATPTWSGGVFLTPIELTAGTTYFVGFRKVSDLAVNFTADTGATQLLCRFGWNDDGEYASVLNLAPMNQPILRFNGTPPDAVPEAGTLTALAGLLCGGGLLCRRRRR